MNWSLLPNIITVMRIILIVPIIWLLLNDDFTTALILFAVAGISDAIDGFLARHFSWQSWWGSVLDPLADKLLQVSCYITLAWMGHIPVWLVAVIVLRDVVIVAGALAYHHTVNLFEAEPSLASKFNTFVQIVLVLLVVLHVGVYAVPTIIIDVMIGIVLITTLYSGIDYVIRWGKRAMQHKSG